MGAPCDATARSVFVGYGANVAKKLSSASLEIGTESSNTFAPPPSLKTFLTSTKSWFVGDNIPGKAHAVLLYANTAPAYRAKLAETAAKG
jgi:hypothetical protein